MQTVIATFRNGRIELSQSVDWPDGTAVEVTPVETAPTPRGEAQPPMTWWPPDFFDRLREQWGEEPFERPPQGESEVREEW